MRLGWWVHIAVLLLQLSRIGWDKNALQEDNDVMLYWKHPSSPLVYTFCSLSPQELLPP